MAKKTRSPRYPNISLSEAIQKVRMIYDREQMDPASSEVMAENMGYKGLNGASLKALSSLRKYGLLEGRGTDLRVSRDAQTLILDSADSESYGAALRRSALNPELFSQLRSQFKGSPSERNVAVHLEKEGFKRSAAELAAKNFLDTIALLSDDSETSDDETGDESEVFEEAETDDQERDLGRRKGKLPRKSGMRQDIFTLDEGDVLFQWPESLSPTSYEDLETWTQLVLRKVKRSVLADDSPDNLNTQSDGG